MNEEERYFKTYHWLIGAILAGCYGLWKFGFSWEALFAAWGIVGTFLIIAILFVLIVDKLRK